MTIALDRIPPPSETRTMRALGLVAIVFFVFGVLTNLNNVLVPHFKSIFDLGFTGVALVPGAFFSAYLFLSLPAGRAVAWLGYPRAIALGLVVSMVGALLFYPAAALLSYPLFLGGLFVLAAGITVLQVTCNPYVTLLGDNESAPSRLALVQGFYSVGSALAPFIGSVWILARSHDSSRAEKALAVQPPYLAWAAALLALAAATLLLNLPERSQGHAATHETPARSSLLAVLRVPHLRLGVLGIFCYVGAEVTIGSFLVDFITDKDISSISVARAADFVAYYWGGMMIGRFAGAAVLRRHNPRVTLAACAFLSAVLVVIATVVNGHLAIAALVAVGFFNSIQFPTIFTLAIEGLGPGTNHGSSLLIMAAVGGAIVPLILGALADRIGVHHAYAVNAACYLYVAYYGLLGSRLPTTP